MFFYFSFHKTIFYGKTLFVYYQFVCVGKHTVQTQLHEIYSVVHKRSVPLVLILSRRGNVKAFLPNHSARNVAKDQNSRLYAFVTYGKGYVEHVFARIRVYLGYCRLQFHNVSQTLLRSKYRYYVFT